MLTFTEETGGTKSTGAEVMRYCEASTLGVCGSSCRVVCVPNYGSALQPPHYLPYNICACGYIHHRLCTEARGQFAGVGSLLPPRRFHGLSFCLQVCC